MKKFLRRFFPTRPYLGATLVLVLLVQAVAIAEIATGKGKAQEGPWMDARTENEVAGTCTYEKQGDYTTASTLDYYTRVNEHAFLCRMPAPSTGCVPNPISKPNGCEAVTGKDAPRRDHLTNVAIVPPATP